MAGGLLIRLAVSVLALVVVSEATIDHEDASLASLIHLRRTHKSDNLAAVDTSATRVAYVKSKLQAYNAFITDASIRALKYTDMAVGKYEFFRATAHVFYSDLNTNQVISIPSSWKSPPSSTYSSCTALPSSTCQPKTWIEGDAHALNVGIFDNDQNTVKFDLNDFDESLVAPFYWDLIRFSSSLFLHRGLVSPWSLSDAEAQQAVLDYFLASYESTLASVMSTNGETLSSSELVAGNTGSLAVHDKIVSAAASKSQATLLASKTVVSPSGSSTGRKILRSSVIGSLVSDVGPEWTDVANAWSSYTTGLIAANGFSAAYVTIKDKARRLDSGLGSRGVYRFYVLIEGPTSSNTDDILLDVKEQRAPAALLEGSLSSATYTSWFPTATNANRAKTALKAQLNNADNYVGVVPGALLSYLVREVSPYKDDLKPNNFPSKTDFFDFASNAGKAYAYAHARSDVDFNSVYVSYNFEKSYACCKFVWSQFKTNVRDFAESYANQVETDYSKFLTYYTTI